MLSKIRPAWILLIALGFGALAPAARAQEADPVIERMKKDITFLASDECEGRGIGTLGLDMAAQYVAIQFKHAGLKPGGVNGTYFQPFPFSASATLDGDSELNIVGPGNHRRSLQQGADFQVLGTSSAGHVTAPVVFVGYGVTGRGVQYDDYADVDVEGKIVIAIRRLPRWTDSERPFDPANKEDLSAVEVKQLRARAAGAKAVGWPACARRTAVRALKYS